MKLIFMSFLNSKLIFLTKQQKVVAPEPEPVPAPEPQPPATAPPAQEEADLTWEDKEDKLDAENIQPDPLKPTATDKKYQYKEGGCLKLDRIYSLSGLPSSSHML